MDNSLVTLLHVHALHHGEAVPDDLKRPMEAYYRARLTEAWRKKQQEKAQKRHDAGHSSDSSWGVRSPGSDGSAASAQ